MRSSPWAISPSGRRLPTSSMGTFWRKRRSHDDKSQNLQAFQLTYSATIATPRVSCAAGVTSWSPRRNGVSERFHGSSEAITLEAHVRDVIGCVEETRPAVQFFLFTRNLLTLPGLERVPCRAGQTP